MTLTITYIRLRSPLALYPLWVYSFRIVNQLRTTNCVAFRSQARWWSHHYTMSLWRNEKDRHDFARQADHLQAMKKSAAIAREIRTLSIESDTMIPWEEARELLKLRGKTLLF